MGELHHHHHHHPLHQIAESPTHKLLLKQWIKEEDLILRRVALKESRIDSIRREIAALYCSFFALHSTLLLILLSTAGPAACRRSWIPLLCSLICSIAISWAIRYKTDAERHAERLLERDREDGVLLSRCVAELKKKGVAFDLMKEVDALRRAKSLRVERDATTAVRRFSARDCASLFLFASSCAFLGLTRLFFYDVCMESMDWKRKGIEISVKSSF
ncbi:hypothetical protein J5N97_028415 [Dioscorea zingiberensis]|uniref:Uncharacterized protein n=1 Tax=Dioscorea zingiberensis TaxID=325984 RepID=A0A9D5BYX8_9LILI|nr:hypothetical protein J5N97_028415 [Dioscorea zingiberensis]